MDRKREMKLPIYIEAAMGVFLVVILAMAGRNGMIPQNQKNNVMKQSEVEQKSDSDMQNEKEAVLLRWMNLQIISINRDTNIRRKNWQKVEQIP